MKIVNLNTVIENVFGSEGTQEITMRATTAGVVLSGGTGNEVTISQATQLEVDGKGVANIPNGSYKLTVVDGKVTDMVQVEEPKKAAKEAKTTTTSKRSGAASNPKHERSL